jgi:hypothetical protein
MRVGLLLSSALLFCVIALCQGRGDEPQPIENHGIRKDITAAKVMERLGQPKRIARQILLGRHVEQWSYEEPILLRIELRGARGEETRVGSVHPLRSKKP